MSSKIAKVFCGTIIHCLGLRDSDFRLEQDKAVGIDEEGRIAFVEAVSALPQLQAQHSFGEQHIVRLDNNKFLIPGLVDTHLHAPQYSFTGTGLDLPLLDWLNKYTFPMEAKFKDLAFSEQVYRKAILRTLSHGTTTACYFATIHLEASKRLADLAFETGQRAFIGKVCMDQNSPEFYIESTKSSIEETEAFINYLSAQKYRPLITPVITPRFAPSCSGSLMKKLGELAKQYDVPIQSHISENKNEVEWVRSLFPDFASYTQVYDAFGLLTSRTIMAHGIYLSDQELEIFRDRQAGISHCPVSNFSIHSGILDAKRVLNKGVKLGLGTDVSGGYSPSLFQTIRQCITASNTLQIQDNSYVPLTHREAFALATIGGCQVLGLDQLIGNFVPGKAFDALLIDPQAPNSPFDVFQTDSIDDVFQKFLFLGDDRNITSVFVNGKEVIKQKQQH